MQAVVRAVVLVVRIHRQLVLQRLAPSMPSRSLVKKQTTNSKEQTKTLTNSKEQSANIKRQTATDLRVMLAGPKGREAGESGKLEKALRKGEGKLGVLSASLPLLVQEDP